MRCNLPPKRWGNGKSESVVKERRMGFEKVLNQILRDCPAKARPIVVDFFQGNESVFGNGVVVAVVQQQSAQLDAPNPSGAKDAVLRAKTREVVEAFVKVTQQRVSSTKRNSGQNLSVPVEEVPFDADAFRARLRNAESVFVALKPEKEET